MLPKTSRFIFITLVINLSSFFAHSAPAGISKLLDKPNRPTISQVRRYINKSSPQPPFRGLGQNDSIEDAIPTVARIIAELEYFYPRSIILPLGRDSADLGDMIDAFYQNNGVEGKVRRFNASRGTFRNASNQDILAYLETLGFSLRNVKRSRPFIIIDRTYGTSSSQMVQIRKAVYTEYFNRGGAIEDISKKFNIVSLDSTVGVPAEGHALLSSLNVRRTFYTVSESNPIEMDELWHESFGDFRFKRNGTIDVTIHPTTKENEHQEYIVRKKIINDMVRMIKVTGEPEMLEAVKEAAANLGYRFSFRSQCSGLLSAGR